MAKTVALVAGEASGDQLGAELIAALRARAPELRLVGVGGGRMAKAGVASAIEIGPLSVVGFVEGLKAYPQVVAIAEAAANQIAAESPDAVVLIDSWGFTLRVAQRLRSRLPATPLIKYIGPQVFATRPGRAKTLAATVDHLICIHPFEVPYYAPFGLPCTVCGHPAFGRLRHGDGAAWRARQGIAADASVLLVLPGSRSGEVRRTGPVLMQAAAQIVAAASDTQLVVVAAEPVAAAVRALVSASAAPATVIAEGDDKADVFAAATAALAASGTVTTEVALQGTPVVVAYRVGALSWQLIKRALRSKWATLMNIAADREVAPEFLQDRATPDALAQATLPLLINPGIRSAQVSAQDAALAAMGRGGKPAADIAADTVLDILQKGPAAVRH